MKASEMRELPPTELASEIEKVREKIWKTRFQAKGEPLENPGELRELKKNRARLLTLLREKELAGQEKRARKRTRAARQAAQARARHAAARGEPTRGSSTGES